MMARRRLALLFVLGLFAPLARGVADQQKYILLFRQPNASAPATIADDVANRGGNVVARGIDRFMISLPDQALSAIKAHPGVKYLQRATIGPQPVVTPAAAPPGVGTSQLNQDTAAQHLQPAPLWDSSGYSYDGAGNITSIGTTRTYTYDPLSRLTAFTTPGHTETYTYDEFGNTTNRRRDGLDYSLSVDTATNHFVDAYNNSLHDTGGNLTQYAGEQYHYDPFNELREKDVNGTQELYVYTPNDERIGVRTGSEHWIWSIRDEDGKVLRQYESFESNPQLGWTWIEDYVYREGELLGAERMPEEGGRRHFHLDHLGTPRLITGYQGQIISAHDYYPFGTEITPICQEYCAGFSREEPMRFTGQERDFNTYNNDDGTYNDYMHARHSGPAWGRFLSVDPADGEPQHPQSWNRYSYVMNNPMNLTDPDGMFWRELWELITGVVVLPQEQNKYELMFYGVTRIDATVVARDPRHDELQKYNSAASVLDFGLSMTVGPTMQVMGGIQSGNAGLIGRGSLGLIGQGFATAGPTMSSGWASDLTRLRIGATEMTNHGAAQFGARGFTVTEWALAKSAPTKVMTQSDGATVFIREVAAGKFHVVIEGNEGAVNFFRVSEGGLNRLARSFGWH